jgi:hypothetical protein
MKRTHDCVEGPDAWTQFDALVGKLMAVPHSVIQEREAEYKKQVAANPHRRGRKPKKPAAHGPAA